MIKQLRFLGVFSVLALFISYYASITLFMHGHIVNGVTVVHSHPYKTTSDGSPAHEHKASEIQLIAQLSHFNSSDISHADLLSKLIPLLEQTIEPLPLIVYSTEDKTAAQLRAPPIV